MKLKRFITMGLAVVFSWNLVTQKPYAAKTTGFVRYDFTKNDGGFYPVFADYPDSEGVEEFYQLEYKHGKIPISGAGKGLFISGNNHSDDLFMGYIKKISGLSPGKNYRFKIKFKLATNVESGTVGVGGSPGESVYVKCGITSIAPKSKPNDTGYYRLNIDKGNQSQDGMDMVAVGDMAKVQNQRPGKYEFKKMSAAVSAAANNKGCVYLIIGTDSGYEATTSYYLDDIEVKYIRQ